MSKPIYRTTFTVTVLHSDPSIENRTLGTILRDMDEGDLVGTHKLIENGTPLEGEDAIKAINEVGTDTAFFDTDEPEEKDCQVCGEPFIVGENGVANHVDEDGYADHDADADHVPY